MSVWQPPIRCMWRTYKRLCCCNVHQSIAGTAIPPGSIHAPLIVPTSPAAFLLQADVCDGDVSAHRLSMRKELVRLSKGPQAHMAATDR